MGSTPTHVIEADLNGNPAALVDITAYVDLAAGMKHSYGRSDWTAAEPAPGTLALTLDNRAGRFTPGNTSVYSVGTKRGATVKWTCGSRVRFFEMGVPELDFGSGAAGGSTVAIVCTDALARLGRRRLGSMLVEHTLTGNPWAYYPLTESAPEIKARALADAVGSAIEGLPAFMSTWGGLDAQIGGMGFGSWDTGSLGTMADAIGGFDSASLGSLADRVGAMDQCCDDAEERLDALEYALADWQVAAYLNPTPTVTGSASASGQGGTLAPVGGTGFNHEGIARAYLNGMTASDDCELYVEITLSGATGANDWVTVTMLQDGAEVNRAGYPSNASGGYTILLFTPGVGMYNVIPSAVDSGDDFDSWDATSDYAAPSFTHPGDGMPIGVRMNVDNATTPATVSTRVWDLGGAEPGSWDFVGKLKYPLPGYTIVDGYPDDGGFFDGLWPIPTAGKVSIAAVNQSGAAQTVVFANLTVTPSLWP